jgi:hypothetical protein
MSGENIPVNSDPCHPPWRVNSGAAGPSRMRWRSAQPAAIGGWLWARLVSRRTAWTARCVMQTTPWAWTGITNRSSLPALMVARVPAGMGGMEARLARMRLGSGNERSQTRRGDLLKTALMFAGSSPSEQLDTAITAPATAPSSPPRPAGTIRAPARCAASAGSPASALSC